MGSLFERLNAELADVVSEAKRSVVQVRLNGRGGLRGAGAGTIWHEDGLIMTNAHVIAGRGDPYGWGGRGTPVGRDRLEVALNDGRVLRAQVIARDDSRDLAALSISAHDLPVVRLGSARRLHAGQWVFALGHPWGVQNAVTGGVVIRVGRGLPEMATQGEYVVADLHLRPGNSGGPLVDAEGRLVGVNTLMTGLSVGVAVTVDSVKEFLKGSLGIPVAAAVGVDVI